MHGGQCVFFATWAASLVVLPWCRLILSKCQDDEDAAMIHWDDP